MITIDDTTDRATLETAAIVECGFGADVVSASSDDALRDMIIEWIMSGDECADV